MQDIIIVRGRGIACAIERGERNGRAWVRFVDHGPTPRSLGKWEWSDNTRVLTDDEARAAIQRERHEAGVRGVACNSPGCWCIEYLGGSNA